MKTMKPGDPNWNDFCDKLARCLYDHGCDGISTTLAEDIILNDYPEYDYKQSSSLWMLHGGFCDCEILMNVVQSMEN